MSEILLYAFVVVVGIHILYTNFLFSFFNFSKVQKKKTKKLPPLSVVICAKNEEENIPVFLPHIINQDYPEFEIVLINDRSYDETQEVFKSFASKHDNISIVNILDCEHFFGNKKYALALGLKKVKYKHVICTDADCYPNSKYWLQEIAHNFSETKQIVLGYGAYEKIDNSFLNKLIRYETLLTAIQYFSYAKIGIPYMGVGRNLAYEKELYEEVGGFKKHIHVKSGDDDLLINEISNSKNTAICFHKNAHTLSPAKNTFKSWLHQKRRHVTTAHHYKWHHQLLLGLYFLHKYLFWVLFIGLSFVQFNTIQHSYIFIGTAVSKFILEWISLGISAKKLNEKDLIWTAPLLDGFLVFFQMFIFIRNNISKPKYW